MEKAKTDINPGLNNEEEDEKAYSPPKVVLPAMAAIFLAVFLVALVSTPRSTNV